MYRRCEREESEIVDEVRKGISQLITNYFVMITFYFVMITFYFVSQSGRPNLPNLIPPAVKPFSLSYLATRRLTASLCSITQSLDTIEEEATSD